MDTSLCYPLLKPDMENIMSVMHELKEKNCSDSTLLSNLDFAERFLRGHPLQHDSQLVVKGNYSCVKIGQYKSVFFTITSENNQTFVNARINRSQKIVLSDIHSEQFFNHSCQDEFKSCFEQAQEAFPKKGLAELHIKCNRFSVTYAYAFSNSPCQTVETQCHLKLQQISAEGLLSKKVWLQKEKPACHGVIACLDYLIKQYLTTSSVAMSGYRFVMHADKEMIVIEIISDGFITREYVLLHDHEGVSMFPPTLQ